MSGVNRAILSEVVASGKSSEAEVVAAFQPEAILEENGRAQGAKGADNDSYTGEEAQPAK